MSLRALEREFELDDEGVGELVDELVHVQRVAVLEKGTMLTWAGLLGAAASAPGPEALSVSPPVPEAERRQLTVMFCDLVESTALGQQLDAEDFRDIVRRYYDATRTVTDRWGGRVATYMGDGLLVYFGYPQAQEDDAERAATSLARLWQAQGKTAEAHGVLQPVYDWFTEGFDTQDLQDAKILLEELA